MVYSEHFDSLFYASLDSHLEDLKYLKDIKKFINHKSSQYMKVIFILQIISALGSKLF